MVHIASVCEDRANGGTRSCGQSREKHAGLYEGAAHAFPDVRDLGCILVPRSETYIYPTVGLYWRAFSSSLGLPRVGWILPHGAILQSRSRPAMLHQKWGIQSGNEGIEAKLVR